MDGGEPGVDPCQARNPSFSPFFLARRMSPCRCLESAPMVLQNSVMTCLIGLDYNYNTRDQPDLKHACSVARKTDTQPTCECSAIAFPLSWLKRLRPMMLRATTTSGANRPLPAFTLPIIRAGDRSSRALDRRRDMATTE